ncbi:DUF2690 domain-containing protein [Streptomyces europaeiscabiei]|uniref:DUF2690 domain-containing protein n=1 Tax=Streptomyces europaeiscabiei TaxID=146819 RepID=UPI0029AF9622|nr:DUF2690 domain-containing protein [Streptomyces europaeiscabiei]MDX2771357.1 DUF2690 domain-containing protein [Streptomyces europaeiscabiei]
MRIRRSITAAVVAVAAAVCTPVVLASEAQADVGCYGDYCSGQDPMATGCGNDAQTVAWKDLTGARLEMRWSPTCKTQWARYHQYPRGWYLGGSPIQLRAVQDTGYTQSYNFPNAEAGGGAKDNETYWSPMIYTPNNKVKAELVVACGDRGIIAAAIDCATGGIEETAAW